MRALVVRHLSLWWSFFSNTLRKLSLEIGKLGISISKNWDSLLSTKRTSLKPLNNSYPKLDSMEYIDKSLIYEVSENSSIFIDLNRYIINK